MLRTITIGSLVVDMYQLMMDIGLLGMFFHVIRRRKKVSLSLVQSITFVLLMIVSGLFGAYLFGFLQTQNFGAINMFGAIFTVPLVMPIIGKLFKLTGAQVNDLSAVCLAIVNTFVKVGCFLGGCCEGIVSYIGNGYFQWPAQIMGVIGGTIIILWLLRIEAYETWQGALYPLFMLSYGIMRFFLNAITYIPIQWWGLQPSQWFALLSAIIGFIWLVIYKNPTSQKRRVFKS